MKDEDVAKAEKAHPQASYSPVFVCYVPDEDRFYLVSEDRRLALPLPTSLHGHLGEMVAPFHKRLGCHAGFLPWPPATE